MRIFPILAGMLAFTATSLPAQPSVRRPPTISPQFPAPPFMQPRRQRPPTQPPTTPLVHFDATCRNVARLAAGWGGSLSFDCVKSNGQTETLRIASIIDATGMVIGDYDQAGGDHAILASIHLSAYNRHFEATAQASISQVIQAFILYRAAHPESVTALSVRGIESVDPANAGDRVVRVAYFNVN